MYYTGKIKECQEPLGTQSYDKCSNNYSNTKPKHTGTSHIAIMPDSLISEKCIGCRMARFERFKDFHRLYLFTIMVHPTTLNKVCQVLYFVVARYTPSQSLGKSAPSS